MNTWRERMAQVDEGWLRLRGFERTNRVMWSKLAATALKPLSSLCSIRALFS